MQVKQIICLANSRKLGGRCFAGKEVPNHRWVRPVSDRPEEELTVHEMHCGFHGEPGLLDVVNVPIVRPRPKSHQPENWLADPGRRWEWVRRIGRGELQRLVDAPDTLWSNLGQIGPAQNDRVRYTEGFTVPASLYLLFVRYLRIVVSRRLNGRIGLQGQFTHNGVTYVLRVTDPQVEAEYGSRPLGEYSLGSCFVTVSLGEPFEGFCYKLLAAIIPIDSLRTEAS